MARGLTHTIYLTLERQAKMDQLKTKWKIDHVGYSTVIGKLIDEYSQRKKTTLKKTKPILKLQKETKNTPKESAC